MSIYKSNVETANAPVERVYERLSNPSTFAAMAENGFQQLPDQVRKNLEGVSFTEDAIAVTTPMGSVELKVKAKTPHSLIEYTAENSPIPFGVKIKLQPQGEQTQIETEIDMEIPMMLRGLVGNKIGEVATQFGKLLAMLPY